jgi:hypothetical protein
MESTASFVAYITLTVITLVGVGIFVLGRVLVLWYFRVNEAIETLQRIEMLLGTRLPLPPPQQQPFNQRPAIPHTIAHAPGSHPTRRL